jgi:hypothetical protein
MADPVLIENIDFTTEYTQLVESFKEKSSNYTNFTDADPLMHMLAICAGLGTDLKSLINLGILENFVDTASGQWLDLIGANKQVIRLLLQEADPNNSPPTAAIYESDDDYRLRIKNAPPNNAATAEEYEFFATQFDANIRSARIEKLNANSNLLTMSIVTRDNNGVASNGLKNSLSTYLNGRNIRAINDVIEVVGATASTVNVTATITLLTGASSTAFDDLPGILTTAFNAINDIGRDITLSWLIKTLSTSSVYKVQLVAPASDVIVGETGFAKLGTINLTLAPTSGY